MASEQELERLVIRLIGDDSQYGKMLKSAVAQTQTAANKIERIGRRTGAVLKNISGGMKSVGRSMTVGLTAPLSIFGGLSVKAFADFDSAMTKSTAIMDVTEDQIKAMRAQALALGGQSIQGPEKLAESYFFLASAGLNAEQSMAALPQVTQFATAGAFDMAQATDLLTDAQSALGMTVPDAVQNLSNMTRVSDTLVKANTLANASVEQFSTSLTSKAGASLKVFNKDVEEGVAVLAAYADQGVKAELSGNALDRMLRLLSKSALDNAQAHEELGFSVFNAEGEMRNMADIVGNLEQVLKGMSTEEKVATLSTLGFEARVQQVILPLIGASDAIRRYEKELRNASGTTDEVANKQLKSFTAQLKQTWNLIKSTAIGIGDILAPAVAKMNEWLRMAIGWWNMLSPAVQKMIVYFGAATAALGPLLLAGGSLAGALALIASGVGALSAVSVPMIAAIAAMTAGTVALTAAVGGAIYAFYQLTKEFIDYPGLINTAISATKNFAMKVVGFFVNIQENTRAILTWLGQNWSEVLARIPAAFVEVAGNIAAAMINNFKVAMRVIAQLAGIAAKVFVRVFIAAWKWVFGGGLFNLVTKAFKKLLSIAKTMGYKIAIALAGGNVSDAFLDSFKSNEGPLSKQLGKILADGMKDMDVPSLLPKQTFADLEGPKLNFSLGDDPAIKALDDVDKKTKEVVAATEMAGQSAQKARRSYEAWQLSLAGTTQFNSTMEGLRFGASGTGLTGAAVEASSPAQGSIVSDVKTGIADKIDMALGLLEMIAIAEETQASSSPLVPPELQSEDA